MRWPRSSLLNFDSQLLFGENTLLASTKMTDYEEDQRNEIEVLQSMYPEELEILEESPHYNFTLKVASQNSEDYVQDDGNDDTPSRVGCTVQFTYTPTYPEDLPIMEVISTDSLDDEQTQKIVDFLQEEAENNKGMVMVFTLIQALEEKLTSLVEEMKQLAEETRARKEKEEEEAAQKKFEGTRVTIESFMAWKASFDAERKERKQREKESDQLLKKPSGKELFMRDATLNDSDITFLQEGNYMRGDGVCTEGENVEVDESLFENMDDLELEEDLDDDDDDDPDYIP